MQQICKTELCTGCGACSIACSHHAIEIIPDVCGFIYPTINDDKCVDCGLCQRVCPVNNPPAFHLIKKCYAATSKSEEELLSCSSGGVATVISRYIISTGGVVYGCSAKDIRNVHHIRVDNEDGLEELKGSKYVQSAIRGIYVQIKQDLLSNRKVLFVGTPCQVAGLYGYLQKDYDNLYTADLVCHGVSSQKMLNDNITYYTDKRDISLQFRTKGSAITYGWYLRNHKEETLSSVPLHKDFYIFGFIKSLIHRENCFTCPYAQNKRISDLTLCDFWGLSPNAGFELGKGVSAILVSTEKGKQIVETIKNSLKIKEREIIEATRWNDQLNHPSSKPKHYELFKKLYSHSSFRSSMIKAYYMEYIYDRYIHYKNRLKKLLK